MLLVYGEVCGVVVWVFQNGIRFEADGLYRVFRWMCGGISGGVCGETYGRECVGV